MTYAPRFTFTLAVALLLAAPASAQILETVEPSDTFGEVIATGDFDGDGRDDLAIGVPDENLGDLNNAGLVHVLYGTSGDGLTDTDDQVWTQDSPGINDAAESNDRFGDALAAGDFDGDGFDDLAIGTPGEGYLLTNGVTTSFSGVVNVLYGSSSGLSSRDQTWNQSSPGISFAIESGDRLGAALTAGDFNGDGRDDLAIGVPYEDLGTIQNAGFVHVLFGATGGLTGTGAQSWDQDSPGIASTVEAGDLFGYSLEAGDFNGDGFDELVIGVPYEDLSTSTPDIGIAHVLNGTPSGLTGTGGQTWQQSVGGPINNPPSANDRFSFSLAAGDFDGDGRDDLAFGVPFENFGFNDSGIVHVLYGTNSGLDAPGGQAWHQNITGVSSFVEANDRFGYSLSAGDFDGDGRDDLAIGVPYEDQNAGPPYDIGVVHVLYGSFGSGLSATGEDFWGQSGAVKEAPETDDRFGWALGAGDFDGDGRDDLTIGAPYEDLNGLNAVGVAHTLYGTTSGLTDAGNQLWYQGAAAPLTVALTPIDPPAPVVIARGEIGSFSAAFATGPNPPESFEYWTEAVLPNGTIRTLVGPNTLLLDPEQSVTLQFNLRIPNSAPLGDYTHRLEAGTFPNGVLDSDSYGATIVDSATADPSDEAWLVYDAEGRLAEAGTVLDLRDSAGGEAGATAEVPEAASEASPSDVPVLHAAYPNPFSRTTTLAFNLPQTQRVRLAVYDVLGREVIALSEGEMNAGLHEAVVDASGLSSGVYLVRLEAGGTVQTQRVVLLR